MGRWFQDKGGEMEGHSLFKGRRGGPLNSEQWGVTLLADYLLLHGEPVSSMPAGEGWESRLPGCHTLRGQAARRELRPWYTVCGVKSQPAHSPLWCWEPFLSSLALSFPFYKMGMITVVPTWIGLLCRLSDILYGGFWAHNKCQNKQNLLVLTQGHQKHLWFLLLKVCFPGGGIWRASGMNWSNWALYWAAVVDAVGWHFISLHTAGPSGPEPRPPWCEWHRQSL